jgi:hypothetical protein
MTEERKFAIPLAATLLCTPKLTETTESDKPNSAKEHLVVKAIREGAFILERIDRWWLLAGNRADQD